MSGRRKWVAVHRLHALERQAGLGSEAFVLENREINNISKKRATSGMQSHHLKGKERGKRKPVPMFIKTMAFSRGHQSIFHHVLRKDTAQTWNQSSGETDIKKHLYPWRPVHLAAINYTFCFVLANAQLGAGWADWTEDTIRSQQSTDKTVFGYALLVMSYSFYLNVFVPNARHYRSCLLKHILINQNIKCCKSCLQITNIFSG